MPIVQVGSDARWIGDLRIRGGNGFSLSGAAPEGAYAVAVRDLCTEDLPVRELVDQWNLQFAAVLDAVIGHASYDMMNTGRYVHDIALGNVITDAMRDALGAEIAFTNNGGIRASIPAGPVTMRHVYTVLPFGNFIVKMDLTGAQIRQALEYSYTRRNSLDLQTSGLTYTVYTQPGSAVMDHLEILVGRYIESLGNLDYQDKTGRIRVLPAE